MTTAAIDLFGSLMSLAWDGAVQIEDRRRPGGSPGSDGWSVVLFNADEDEDLHSDCWEVHTQGDETIGVLRGVVRVILRSGSGSTAAEDPAVTLHPGEVFVVPRGHWHRLELDAPSQLFSVTWRRGTRREKTT